MKRMNLMLLLFALVLGACSSDTVKVRGKVEGLKGTVKLLAEIPGKGVIVLDEQQVEDGNINLETDSLTIPARVWVDVDGKAKVEAILDTKDMIWIKGKIKFADQIEATGSGLMAEYDEIKALFKKKFGDELEELDKKIQKIATREKPKPDDEVKLGILFMKKTNLQKNRFNFAKNMAIQNPSKEVCLFLIMDELASDEAVLKDTFKKMKIENKESNIYKVLDSK